MNDLHRGDYTTKERLNQTIGLLVAGNPGNQNLFCFAIASLDQLCKTDVDQDMGDGPSTEISNAPFNTNARVCEYVTGINPSDPRLLDKFQEDQLIVRHKYGLPNVEVLINNPIEYEARVRKAAAKNGVRIATTSECGDYFDRFPKATAVYLPETRTIGADINRANSTSYKSSLAKLEHEFVHAMQHDRYPNLPPELVEYGAYVINFDVGKLRKLSPQDAAFTIFSGLYMGSVEHIYENLGEKPAWDNPSWEPPKDKVKK